MNFWALRLFSGTSGFALDPLFSSYSVAVLARYRLPADTPNSEQSCG
ncbi:MAG: hypothetical protein HRU17_10850 [Polyangiaceae bacterium]|nr:hypothetical protein [Polyangiaceae bacterium]